MSLGEDILQYEKEIREYLKQKLPVDTRDEVISEISAFVTYKTVVLVSNIQWREFVKRFKELEKGDNK